jgi:hypothetical protein
MSKSKVKSLVSKFYEKLVVGNGTTNLRNSLIEDERFRSDFLIVRLYSFKALLYGLIRLSARFTEWSFSPPGNWGVESNGFVVSRFLEKPLQSECSWTRESNALAAT